MSDIVAADHLRSFVDRVLRLKEEQDNISADIRDIYAEAKGVGFDKTALGQVVAHLRKVDKIGTSAVEEKQSVFDMYLDAYGRGIGTAFATHTHEARQERAKRRTSEAMDDNKAFSAELVEAGLITPEAHAENIVLSDAVANKYGAGVLSDADVPSFLKKDHAPLRPHCLNPTLCAGSGREHCFQCRKAMGTEAA
jgi:uncharacterized protein (UPF0335 family)